MKVLICDPIDPEAVETIRRAGIEVDVRDTITAEELEAVVADYDILVVRSRTKVTAAVIDKAPKLKLIVRGGVGVDNIDVEHAQAKGIEVRNTPLASANSVAELTIGYLFALARQIPQATASMKAGQWEKKAFSKGIELAGKTLGLIGCGNIGQLVARKALALGMTVIFHARHPVDIPCAIQVSLDELVARSDFISLHVPLTPETYHIIGRAEFEKMKKGVYIVNCGRGGTLDEDALYDAIVSGKVAGAALDVFEDEEVDRGRRLMALPQVIGSPHVGAGTVEATERVGAEVAQIIIDFARQ
ncbi:MAG: D-2-hydroxyacid dehydrogenase [Anaerolineae bacterium]|nr:D-2-hydroxyacid dehydrogenase [Anaerolineae bacterium]MDW8069371.1 D-2-hydroxyacid dehydrogenase [Anaerolineae bacterium]